MRVFPVFNKNHLALLLRLVMGGGLGLIKILLGSGSSNECMIIPPYDRLIEFLLTDFDPILLELVSRFLNFSFSCRAQTREAARAARQSAEW